MLKKINIQIDGIHCKSCKNIIETEVEVLPGVRDINVHPKTGKCRIEFDDSQISPKKIFQTIEKLNYKVNKAVQKDTSSPKSNKTFPIGIAVVVLFVAVYFVINSLGSNSNIDSSNNAAADKVNNNTVNQAPAKNSAPNDGFVGDRGETVIAQSNKIYIKEATVNDGDLHSFNYYSQKAGKNVYFFVLKAPDGTYRAAANACEVCFKSKKGFKQLGSKIQCVNCRQSYSKGQIAMEKGGCNPGPIDKNVAVNNGSLAINVADVEAVAYLF